MGPLGNDFGDIFGVNFLFEHAGALHIGKTRLQALDLFLKRLDGAIVQASHSLIIIGSFRLFISHLCIF